MSKGVGAKHSKDNVYNKFEDLRKNASPLPILPHFRVLVKFDRIIQSEEIC